VSDLQIVRLPTWPRHQPNLDVVTSALVHRVRLDGDRCTGIDYSAGTNVFPVGCTGEVVLTAGTVGSAQLLLTSGIGPMSGVVYRSARPVPAGQNNHGEALGLIRSHPDAGMPDLQIMFVDVPLRAPGSLAWRRSAAGPRLIRAQSAAHAAPSGTA
jgi:choline dehydrogenase